MNPPPLPPPIGPSGPPPLPAVTLPAAPKGGSGMRVLLVVLGVFLVLGVGGIWLVASSLRDAIKRGEARAARLQHTAAAPEYKILLGQNWVGSGFHVQIGKGRFICASVHQFEGRKPKEMSSLEFDAPIKLKKVVHKQDDLQLITYESKELDAIEPLKFDFEAKVEEGLPVYLYPMRGPLKGRVTSVDRKAGRISIRPETPFEAAGMSGSPIVSGLTGTVIGILTDGDDPDRATRVGAELLRPPQSL